MGMFGSGVKIGMMKKKIQKSFGAVRGAAVLSILAPLTVAGAFLLFVLMLLVFVSSELYLLDWGFFTLGVFTFFFWK
jgi:hypothetical protein